MTLLVPFFVRWISRPDRDRKNEDGFQPGKYGPLELERRTRPLARLEAHRNSRMVEGPRRCWQPHGSLGAALDAEVGVEVRRVPFKESTEFMNNQNLI